jgi:hypothetical protein
MGAVVSESVDLALPCRLVVLAVQLGPEDGVTTLEDLVVQAIAAGRATAPALAELFALPQRILLDVVHTLWSRGYITVDFESGRLDLSDGTREVLAATDGGSLRSASVKSQQLEYLFEPITGMIFPKADGDRRPGEGSVELPVDDGVSETDLPHLELLRAVQSAVRNDRRAGFRRTVLDVGFGNPLLRPAARLLWLSAHAAVQVDEDTDRVSVDLVDDRRRIWSRQARQRVRAYLGDLIEALPESAAAKALRGRAGRVFAVPEDVGRLLERMAEKVSGLSETDPTQVDLKQKELKEAAGQINDRLDAARRARAAVTLVERPEGHLWVLEDLLGSAQRQVVIAAPTIAYDSLNVALPWFEEALERGVRIALMWGRSGADSLARQVHAALFDDLVPRYRPRIMVADRGAGTSACVVVQDNRRAFVGSHSPLAIARGRGGRELGVLIEAAPQGPAVPECVVDLLIWARRNWPRWQDGQRIRMQLEDFPAVPGKAAAPEPGSRRYPPAADSTPGSVRLWADSWGEHYEALAEATQRVAARDSVVELVLDGAHQDFLWRALHGGAGRLVLADDRISAQVADERLARALRTKADAGAAVYLIHPPLVRDGQAAKSFTELADRPDGAVATRTERAGAHVLLADDDVLIGSFPVLGDEMIRRPAATARTTHLGLHVQSASFVTQLASALGLPAVTGDPATDDAPDEQAAPPRYRRGASAALAVLAQAREARGAEGFGACVAECFHDLDVPGEVLEVWHRVGVPDADLRPAAAALVRLGPRIPAVQRARWTAWLVANAWKRRSFMEAALLGRLLEEPYDGLSAAACVAAAALDCGPLGEVLTEAALVLDMSDDNAPAARTVGAVGGLAETLLWAGGEGEQVVRLHRRALTPSWQRLADAAFQYLHKARTALPLDVLAAEVARSALLAQSRQRWDVLRDELDRIKALRQRFDFESGLAMHDRLFAADGLLTRIRAAAAGDADLRVGLPQDLPGNVQQHLERLIADAGLPPIQWSRQRTFLERVESAVREVRALAPTAAVSRDLPGDRIPVVEGCRGIARVMAEDWDDLFTEVRQLPAPFTLPPMALLDRLNPLAQWGREAQ